MADANVANTYHYDAAIMV